MILEWVIQKERTKEDSYTCVDLQEVTFELTMGVVYVNAVEGGNVNVPGNVGRNISHYLTDYAVVKQPFQQLFWRTPVRSHE